MGTVALALAMPAAASAAFPGENGRILFISDATSSLSSIFPGSSTAQIVAPDYGVGEYSADGTKVVYAVERHVDGCNGDDECPGQQEVYIANSDGSGEAPLTWSNASESFPTIHPSGTRIAFLRKADIYEMDLTDGRTRLLEEDAERPHYSPDGGQIAFSRQTGPGADVFVMDADGSSMRNLTKANAEGYNEHPQWSPDGATVYFQSQPLLGGATELKSIPAASPDGSGVVDIVAGNAPVPSPDGELIAFNHNTNRRIHVVSTEGTGLTDLGSAASESYPGSWQPVTGAASATVGAGGGSASTGGEATSDEPAQASAFSPNAGTVAVSVNPYGGSPQAGYASVGQQFDVTAPPASVADPLLLIFLIDVSAVPAGFGAATLEVFRNGALVADCTDPAQAVPDPCVGDRTDLVGGDVSLTVRSSQASRWDIAALDTAKPETKLKKPPRETTKRSLAIKFSSTEEGSTFSCTLDGKKRACVSPYLTGKLGSGQHSFSVTATDAAGNKDATPAKAKFEIVKR